MTICSSILHFNIRKYGLCLCVCYMLLVIMFHSSLDTGDPGHNDNRRVVTVWDKGKVKSSNNGKDYRYDDIFRDKKFETQKKVNSSHENIGVDVNKVLETKDQIPVFKNYNSKIKYIVREPKIGAAAINSSHVNNGYAACSGGDKDLEEAFEFVELGVKFYVYSVFWDQRLNDFDNKDGNAYLRVMTVISAYVAKHKREMYCLFNDTWRDVTIPVLATYYEMCENHGRIYGGYILSCKVPNEIYNPKNKDSNNLPICSVKISPSKLLNDPLAREFKVINTEPQENRNTFSVCTSPLYGTLNEMNLIEFIELSSILGASHFTFYNFDISDNIIKLMNYYHKQGKVSLIPWSLPSILDKKKMWYNGQLVAILDCLFRNMARSHFVVFNDIDEYIIPYGNFTDWHDMMRSIDKEEHCAYQLNSAFFDPRHKQNVLKPGAVINDLITMTHTQRTLRSSRIRTKCIVKPSKVFEAGIHHISKPIEARLETFRVDLPVALVHHYRTCQQNFGMNCNNYEQDAIIPNRYGQKLIENVGKSAAEFNNSFKEHGLLAKIRG